VVDKPSSRESRGDLFIFPSGTVVAWNVPDRVALRLVQRVLPPAARNSHSGFVEVESEDLEYLEDISKDRCDVVGDTIVIGTKPIAFADEADASTPSKAELAAAQISEVDNVLAKIAFSSGLARSTKLAVLERLTDAYFASTRSIPLIMSRGSPLPVTRPAFLRKTFEMLGFGSRLPFSRPFILRKTGELLNIRAQLNLYSELTDSLPDLFWDSRHELGLEGYYDLVGRALDVGVRIKVLNEKMDYAQEIASVLRETLSERHNLRLEWGIIILIFIEVVFEFSRGWSEHTNKNDVKNSEALIEQQAESKPVS
jgi:required for meiotic nuclear division protein 1